MYTEFVLKLFFLTSLISVSTITADKHTGLCPPGYPRQVNYEKTGQCYPVGQQGPCGKLMTLRADPYNSRSGYCGCNDLGTTNCRGRPLLYWPSNGRCHFAYSQGPCKKGQILQTNKYGQAQCRKNPCPNVENQRDLLNAESSSSDFYFSMNNKCFLTGTRAFCKNGEKVYFSGTDPYPRCFSYKPWSCSDDDESPTKSGGGVGGFGIATDDI